MWKNSYMYKYINFHLSAFIFNPVTFPNYEFLISKCLINAIAIMMLLLFFTRLPSSNSILIAKLINQLCACMYHPLGACIYIYWLELTLTSWKLLQNCRYCSHKLKATKVQTTLKLEVFLDGGIYEQSCSCCLADRRNEPCGQGVVNGNE